MSGNIKDAASGEDLIGATIVVKNLQNTGTTSNAYGFYSLTLEKGQYQLSVQFVGYETEAFNLVLDENKSLNVEMKERSFEIGNITVTGERADRNISSVDMGNIKMIPGRIESIPVIFGERDVFKTIQLTAGVKPAGEGSSGFYVRGGGIDQNLISLDEAPVYNASHLMGFFSVFNSESIKDANLMKGSIPVEFGGRASSVFDIKMKDGNQKEYGVTGNVGLISSGLTVEGPVIKDKSSFVVSGRRTYADMFLVFSNDEDVNNSTLYFYDLNLKTNYKINKNNRIFLSGYFGRDKFKFAEEFGFDWGNKTGTFRWNHNFSEKLFSNTSVIFSNYSYNINILRDLDVDIRSEIQDWNIKQDFSYYANVRNTIKYGGNMIYHNILPGEISVPPGSIYSPLEITRRKAIEWAAYVSNQQTISEKIKLYYGLRLALFSNIGPGEFYEFDDDGALANTIEKEDFEFVKTQGGLEPRLGLIYMLGAESSVKASYNRIYQFLHLLSNSTTATPTDLWLPSSNNVKPQISDQFSLGYFRNFKNNEFESSLEIYYKDLKNQIDYKNSADLIFNSTVEAELVFGRGWAYGAELTVKRNYGRINGWLSYTWSKTMRQFDEINQGDPFPARHDRTHDFSIVGMYDINDRLKFSATWVYYTGNAVTFPSGRYEIDGQIVEYYTERNGYRMPDYHRLDIGLTWVRKKTSNFESSWNFSIYNAYARENAYYIDFRESETNPGETEAVQFSLFKIVPSVSYKFKF
ncbi:TonB-dependent receptor [Maribellus comscasis]|uniref:TonB-dependent receptor n=1 Tax=Maribellus comscasis TaxID=2681766 RepID=UPI001C2DDD1D|nr:TonB-dependent receptor [Maribellus comscasis]